MNEHWILLINRREKFYYKMHDGLGAKYLRKLRENPNCITYETFNVENEIDNRISELNEQGYTSNSLLENLAFDW